MLSPHRVTKLAPYQTTLYFYFITRLSYDTKPELVLSLLLREWCLEKPKLLITINGGKVSADFAFLQHSKNALSELFLSKVAVIACLR